jgi:N-acetyl-anhydromuramyl-L-alanine amidase AmpD
MFISKNHNLIFGPMDRRKSTEFLIVHHSGSDTDNIFTIHNFHKKDLGWSGVGYHYVIHQNGDCYIGRGEAMVGAHAFGNNHNSIGICFCGNLNVSHLTDAQKKTGIELMMWILKRYPEIKIHTHRDVGKTECPGKNFDVDIIFRALAGNVVEKEHWAEEYYNYLTKEVGLTIHEKRYDDKVTRGEQFALMARMFKAMNKGK